MDYGKGLAMTGPGIAIGGTVFGPPLLVAIAGGAILLGGLVIRFGWRRKKAVTEL